METSSNEKMIMEGGMQAFLEGRKNLPGTYSSMEEKKEKIER